MKLILKNLKQVQYEIIIQSEKITVKDLKIEIEKLYSFDSTQIKLVHNGTILDNQKTLEEYKITENSVIIIMNVKTKKIQNQNIPKPTDYPEKKDPIQIQPEKENKESISDILKDNLSIQVNSLVDMGFERSQVEIAVRAANGRIDLAIEYLNNGIPDNINNNRGNIRNNNRERQKNENEITRELKKQAGVIKMICKDNKFRIFEVLNNIKKNDPGLMRLITDYRDDFKKYLDTPITEEEKKNYENIEHEADKKLAEIKEKKEKEKKEKEEKEKEEKEKKEKEEKEKEEKEKEKEEKENKEKEGEDKGGESENKVENTKENKPEEIVEKKEGEKNENKKEDEKDNKGLDNKNENNTDNLKDEKEENKNMEKEDNKTEVKEENKPEEKEDDKTGLKEENKQVEALENKLGRQSTTQEKMDYLKLSKDRVEELERIKIDTVSINNKVGKDENTELGNFIPVYDNNLEDYMVNVEFAKMGKTILVVESPDGNKTEFDVVIKRDTYDIKRK